MECELAVSRLVSRLRRYTHLSCAVDLESDAEYAFRLRCANAVGASEWSGVLRCGFSL